MHTMDPDKTYWKKKLDRLLKNAMSYAEQILETTTHEITAVRPPTSHL